jgi:putative NADH-flavin reductase
MSKPSIDFAALNVVAVVRHTPTALTTRIVYIHQRDLCDLYLTCVNEEHDVLVAAFDAYLTTKGARRP